MSSSSTTTPTMKVSTRTASPGIRSFTTLRRTSKGDDDNNNNNCDDDDDDDDMLCWSKPVKAKWFILFFVLLLLIDWVAAAVAQKNDDGSSIHHGLHHHHHHRSLLDDKEEHHHRHHHSNKNNYNNEHCGTPERTPEQKTAFDRMTKNWKTRRNLQQQQQQQQQNQITLPVCFHIIRPTREAAAAAANKDGDKDDNNNNNLLIWDATLLQAQLDHLNHRLSAASCCNIAESSWCKAGDCSIETGIRFEMALVFDNQQQQQEEEQEGTPWKFNNVSVLESSSSSLPAEAAMATTSHPNACITRSFNDTWYAAAISSTEEYQMMQSLRHGDATVLNIYYNDVRGPYGQERYLLGHATYPEWYSLYPALDGVVVSQYAVVNDANPERFKYGETLVHEVGHWLGLPHTFHDGDGSSCEVGDGIEDTAAEKRPATQCNPQRDTCPSEGLDPIHNFMDYTEDICLYEFTPGQLEIMMAAVDYRLNFERNNDIVLSADVPSEPVDLEFLQQQFFKLEIEGASFVECLVTSDSGTDAVFNLAMRIDEKPDYVFDQYDCSAFGADRCAVSTLEDGSSTVWLGVTSFGETAANGVTVTCSIYEPFPVTALPYGSVSSITLDAGELSMYALDLVPEGTWITCRLNADNGDGDIYLRFNNQIYVSEGRSYSHASPIADSDSKELFWVKVPPGTSEIYLGVYGFERVADAAFVCFSTMARPEIALVDGVQSKPIALELNEVQLFTLEIEEGNAGARCTGSSGNGFLLMQWGSEPDLKYHQFDCISVPLSKPCKVSYAGSGDRFEPVPVMYVLVHATTPLEDLSIVCEVLYPEISNLIQGVESDPVDILFRQERQFELDVSPGSNVTCVTDGAEESEGEVDLYVRFDKPLPLSRRGRAKCSSETSSSKELCSVLIPGNTTQLYVTLKSYGGNVSRATVVCDESISSPSSTSQLAEDGLTLPPMEKSLSATVLPIVWGTAGFGLALSMVSWL